MKFPDSSRHSSMVLGTLSVTHIMLILVLSTCMDANMQFTIYSFRHLLPNIFLIFSKIPDISLTTVNSPDMSSFSRQQGDHSPDNVKFPDASRHSSVALGMLSVTHIMLALVLNTCMDANMQFIINSFRQLFPHKIFFPDNSPTFP